MADDTQRLLTTLLDVNFRDGQEEGSITPQDMRDLLVSITPSIGAIYFSAPVETIISAVSTKTLALGTTLLIPGHNMDMPQNNRIRYIGPIDRHFILDAAIASVSAGNNKMIQYQLFKNGVAIAETLMTRTHGTGSDRGALAMTTNVHLEPNDYIELFVSNETDDSNITIENGTLNLAGFLLE